MMSLQRIVRVGIRALLAATLVGTALIGGGGTALADDPGADYNHVVTYASSRQWTCITPWRVGVYGQYGAWGDFVDGCTVTLKCQTSIGNNTCSVYLQTDIRATTGRVTQNARLRIISATSNQVLRFRDRSCAGNVSCSNSDSMTLTNGQYASVQCNGVKEHRTPVVYGKNSCSVLMHYEG